MVLVSGVKENPRSTDDSVGSFPQMETPPERSVPAVAMLLKRPAEMTGQLEGARAIHNPIYSITERANKQ